MRVANDLFKSMRTMLARLIVQNGSWLSALKRIPGFQFCVKRLNARLLPTSYRMWFQVQKGAGKGIWLRLNPRTGAQYYLGQADTDLQRILQENLRPGMVFYDIGSNNGFFSLLAGRIVGPEGQVVAFEAEPRLGGIVLENIDRNSAHNVRLVQSAVWSSSGFVDFCPADPSISPDLGLGRVVTNSGVKVVVVPSLCLDEFVETERPPDLIKCDVEGAEVEIFRGAKKVLTKYKPLVECEVHSDEVRRLLPVMFQELKYDVRWLSGNHFFAVPYDLPGRKMVA